MIKAKISEIFCSIQGEGLYLGQKQIFVRFAGCNLDCDYCDESKAKDGEKFSLQSPEEVVEKIKLFKKKRKSRGCLFNRRGAFIANGFHRKTFAFD